MQLDRNITTPRRGKYALIKLRGITSLSADLEDAFKTLQNHGLLDWGGADSDFFVIRLKDKYAAPALAAYALAAYREDPEWSLEVLNLAKAAAEHPDQKVPD
jgi:hypothetical protein